MSVTNKDSIELCKFIRNFLLAETANNAFLKEYRGKGESCFEHIIITQII